MSIGKPGGIVGIPIADYEELMQRTVADSPDVTLAECEICKCEIVVMKRLKEFIVEAIGETNGLCLCCFVEGLKSSNIELGLVTASKDNNEAYEEVDSLGSALAAFTEQLADAFDKGATTVEAIRQLDTAALFKGAVDPEVLRRLSQAFIPGAAASLDPNKKETPSKPKTSPENEIDDLFS